MSKFINFVEPELLQLACEVVYNQGNNYILEGAQDMKNGYCHIYLRNMNDDTIKLISCPISDDYSTKENIEKYNKVSEIVDAEIVREEKNLPPKLIEDKKIDKPEINSEYFIFYN